MIDHEYQTCSALLMASSGSCWSSFYLQGLSADHRSIIGRFAIDRARSVPGCLTSRSSRIDGLRSVADGLSMDTWQITDRMIPAKHRMIIG
jgi:hypothetical protein